MGDKKHFCMGKDNVQVFILSRVAFTPRMPLVGAKMYATLGNNFFVLKITLFFLSSIRR